MEFTIKLMPIKNGQLSPLGNRYESNFYKVLSDKRTKGQLMPIRFNDLFVGYVMSIDVNTEEAHVYIADSLYKTFKLKKFFKGRKRVKYCIVPNGTGNIEYGDWGSTPKVLSDNYDLMYFTFHLMQI